MGYAGGNSIPSYKELGWHSEVIEVDYDPNIVSYENLVNRFFEMHDETLRPYDQRVKSIVFTRSDNEYKYVKEKIEALKVLNKKGIYTEVKKFDKFYIAEDEHQFKYLKKETGLFNEMLARYPSTEDQLQSILVSKMNASVLGLLDQDALDQLIETYSLSSEGKSRLYQINGFK